MLDGIKLIVSDLDQTLVGDDRKLSPLAKKGIKGALDNGVVFVISSGRSTANLIKIGRELRSEGIPLQYVSGFNGAEVYDLVEEKYILSDLIDSDEVSRIGSVLKELDLDYMIYDSENIYGTDISNKYIIEEQVINEIPLVNLDKHISSPKVLGAKDPKYAKEKAKEVAKRLPEYLISVSLPFFIEVNKDGISKGKTALRLGEILGISESEIACFGDSGNDRSMFEVISRSFAPSSGSEDIRSLAKYVVGSIDEEGISNLLIDYYLK